jgi:hypothetical protein
MYHQQLAQRVRMKDQRHGRKTSPGFADPHAPVRLDETGESAMATSPPAAPAALPAIPVSEEHAEAAPNRARSSRNPIVDIEVVRERGRLPRQDAPQSCYEIWTQNTVYLIDARMRCVLVRDLASGEAKAEHPFLGARLVGGQTQEPGLEMSYPLPRPGACAVFDMKKNNRRQFTRTSVVERIVMRLRFVTITDGNDVPSWDELIQEDE